MIPIFHSKIKLLKTYLIKIKCSKSVPNKKVYGLIPMIIMHLNTKSQFFYNLMQINCISSNADLKNVKPSPIIIRDRY